MLVWLGLGAAGLAGCGWVGVHDRVAKPDGFLLHGYVSIAGASSGSPGTPCLSQASDIAAGAPVKVVDEGGAQLASGSLGDGVLAATGNAWRCNFPFDIGNVPGAADAVLVEIGRQPAARFTTAELREGRAAVINVGPDVSPS
jgi:hypothetical protein